jgi:sterol desaturase/sphingolipid hydroxylase (fatty acid hydroxylase superfamily)
LDLTVFPDLLVFFTFLLFSLFTLFQPSERQNAFSRTRLEWFIDAFGLILQGIVIPFLQYFIVFQLYAYLLPQEKASWKLSPLLSFLLQFLLVDYLYYWNHRLLHSDFFWSLHRLHHSSTQFDLWISSRNTILAPFCIVYLWINPLFLYLLHNPFPFLLSMAFTASLDLWRHTRFTPSPKHPLHSLLQIFWITPHEHAWHHSQTQQRKNFGANFSLWDRLHQTYLSPNVFPTRLGLSSPLNLGQEWLFPWKRKKYSTVSD